MLIGKRTLRPGPAGIRISRSMEAENREPDEGTKPGTKKSLIVLTVVIALIVAALTIHLPNLASVAVNGVSQTNTTPSLGTTDSSSSS